MHRIRRSTLGALVVGAAVALCGTWSPRSAADDGTDADDEARVERLIRRHIPGLTPDQRARRAAAAGELRISGPTRLSGRVFATHVHVERGAQVVADGDLVIYSTGGIVIDAPIGGAATAVRRKRLKVGKPGTGADGADGAAITMIDATGDIAINAPVTGNPGLAGENMAPVGPYARGGDGGRGGAVTILAKKKDATITVNAAVSPGRGGDGGSATVLAGQSERGEDGESVAATGGRGGDCGSLKIQATHVIFAGAGTIAFPDGVRGGAATATGGIGGDAVSCFASKAGAGGGARAVGGKAGRGADVFILAATLEPAGVGAGAFVQQSSVGGGGEARAYAGAGGLVPLDCLPSVECPAKGRNGADGGGSGTAYARGGDGNSEARILGGAFAGRTPAAVEEFGGFGGDALAVTGNGRDGAVGENAQRPGAGGRGGRFGAMTAIGGRGGSCRVGTYVLGTPNSGGPGGHAAVGGPSFSSGRGGAGGDCCGRPGGFGGLGGKAGAVAPAIATPGKGGACRSGQAGEGGTRDFETATVGAAGPDGADCSLFPGVNFTPGTFPGSPTHGATTSFYVGVSNTNAAPLAGLVIEFFLKKSAGDKAPVRIATRTVDVDGAAASPGYRYVAVDYAAPAAGTGRVLQIRANGKVVAETTFDVK